MKDSAIPLDRFETADSDTQGSWRKVLFVCESGINRSATAAQIFCQSPYYYNTRACGISPVALVVCDSVLVYWADEIVCMEKRHREFVLALLDKRDLKPVHTLNVPDDFEFRDPMLTKKLYATYEKETSR